jgi:hypothetical protein
MDRVYLEEFVRAYGSDPIVPDLKPFIKSHQSELEEVFPHVNWDQPKLSPEDIGTLVERYGSQGLYLRKKQQYRTTPFDPNRIASRLKTALAKWRGPAQDQAALAAEFLRLRQLGRAHARIPVDKSAKFVRSKGGIVITDANNRVRGSAVFDEMSESKLPPLSDSCEGSFLRNVRFRPR